MSVSPHKHDVIFGRGRLINAHPGNIRFRSLVSKEKANYSECTVRHTKKKIAKSIFDKILSLDPPGRFLVDSSGKATRGIGEGVWACVEEERAIEKIMHCLREKNRRREELHQDWIGMQAGSPSTPLAVPTAFASLNHSRNQECATMDFKADSAIANYSTTLQNFHISFQGTQRREDQIHETSENFGTELPQTNAVVGDNSKPSFDKKNLSKREKFIKIDVDNVSSPGQIATTKTSADFESNHCVNSNPNSFVSSYFDDDFDFIETEEMSLRQWIDASKSGGDASLTDYIESALIIAAKLTDFLIRAKKHPKFHCLHDAMPFCAINSDNVILIVANQSLPTGSEVTRDLSWDCFETQIDPDEGRSLAGHKNNTSCIVTVKFESRVRLPPSGDSEASFLWALGCIFYELFSKGDQIRSISTQSNTLSLHDMRLSGSSNRGNDDDESASTGRKIQKSNPSPVDNHFNHHLVLGSVGIPHPLIILVKNLLMCNQGEFCGDDAYKSLDELLVDLNLMLCDPSRFLFNTDLSSNQALPISDKLYGRDEDYKKLLAAYKRSSDGQFCGALIMGEAGVGKSTLAKCIRDTTHTTNGYFVSGIFDQNATMPFSTIGDIFNSLCDEFAKELQSIDDLRQNVAKALTDSLGREASLLNGIVPNLSKLMPLVGSCESSCVDAGSRARYLLLTLLETLTKFSKPVTIFMDDIQWIDPASLTFCRTLVQIAKANRHVFLVMCFRDDRTRDSENSQCYDWLQSISGSTLEKISLSNLNREDVNQLVSDSLHVSPRLTRSLSAVIHRKCLGNPFFLRQTIELLVRKDLLYFSMTERRWKWDLDKISDLEINDDIVLLLMCEMTKLPDDLLLGLKATSCVGANVPNSIVDILSKHLGFNLSKVLSVLAQRGFLNVIGSTQFRFVHDRIYRAAYDLMTRKQQRENHMKFGLAICSYVLENCKNNYDMLFIGLNQVNRGGLEELSDPRQQRVIIAQLNLKAGYRALALTDFSAALSFFEQGIKFLGTNHWDEQYQLSLDLFSVAAESACAIIDTPRVKILTDEVICHSHTLEDRLPCLYHFAKSLRTSRSLPACGDFALGVLEQLGEDVSAVLATPSEDSIRSLNVVLERYIANDSIIKMRPHQEKRYAYLMEFYNELIYSYYGFDPSRVLGISKRMITLTISNGLADTSSLAFAYYGMEITARGYPIGYKLGNVALKLAENSKYISNVTAFVKQYISWVAEPFHAIAECNIAGFYSGMRMGDEFSACFNKSLYISTSFLCGNELVSVKKSCREFVLLLLENKRKWFIPILSSLFWFVAELMGSDVVNSTSQSNLIPNGQAIKKLAGNPKNCALELLLDTYSIMKTFYFRQNMCSVVGILDRVVNDNTQIRPSTLVGVFFEGLIAFSMARTSTNNYEWSKKGDIALAFLKKWESSKWNFENKIWLLEAEKMYFLGFYDRALQLYQNAVESSAKHKFPHELALSLELQGLFLHDIKMHKDAKTSLEASVGYYRDWGANAVADRVEQFMRNESCFGSHRFCQVFSTG